MSKHLKVLLAVALALLVAAPAMAAEFKFHGDLNNRFLVYTDQINFFSSDAQGTLQDQDSPDSFGEIKYRLWVEASTDDGKVKGVYAIELGGLRFGAAKTTAGASQGGIFSGDGVNIETRWAYTDFQLPGVDSKARFQIGLFTHKVNPLFWAETAMGVKFYTDNWYLAWLRPRDTQTVSGGDWGDGDLDAFSARYDLKLEPIKLGIFANYFVWDVPEADKPVAFSGFNDVDVAYSVDSLPASNFDMFAIGIDGNWSMATGFGKVFVNWDAIYENGSIDDITTTSGQTSLDLSAYMLHADVGVGFGAATVTYSVYYASGDDDPNDGDLDAYMEVDTDATYSVIFNEGGYTDDDYFSDHYAPFGDKGVFVNKLALDFQVSKQTKIGAAVLYLMTAEDVTLINGQTEDSVGTEIDAYVNHKLYSNLELALNVGYLAADDVMDRFEDVENGSSDIDVWRSTAKIRYKF